MPPERERECRSGAVGQLFVEQGRDVGEHAPRIDGLDIQSFTPAGDDGTAALMILLP
jgi:hypothetical protein